ncbi:MAG: hypothetical protein HOQ02_12130 [Lysobacter sp.]|nr:hypothetical protein [Lysobacter sp.]
MATPLRWFVPAALAAGLGLAALAPAPAYAQNDALALTRQVVDIADVVVNGGVPYYRYGHYGPDDRLVVDRDYDGRPVYYRLVPRTVYVTPPRVYYPAPRVVYRGYPPPYGHAYGYWRHHDRDWDEDHGRRRHHDDDDDDD